MATDLQAAPFVTGPPAIGDREFQFLREIIQRETGIKMPESKRSLVAGRLSRRLRALHLEGFRQYCEFLQGSGRKAEMPELVNCMTTNKTSFFREADHFDVLRAWLPVIAAERRSRPIRIWCAACSTGEEPYTITMTALDTLASAADFRILATDIDSEVLKVAAKGVYPEAALAPSRDFRRRYFLRGVGDWAGYTQVKPDVRAPIEFRPFNLVQHQWTLSGRFDAIFLRNVIIYFDRETQTRIFGRLSGYLEPDGLLFVGSSESLFWLPQLFSPVAHAVYRPVAGSRSAA